MNVKDRREVNWRSVLKTSLVVWLTCLSVAGCSRVVHAQQPKTQSQTAEHAADNDDPEVKTEAPPPGEVNIEARHVLTVYQPLGDYTPQERADRIAERIIAAAKDGNTAAE